jgi:Amt family ammonium transporter
MSTAAQYVTTTAGNTTTTVMSLSTTSDQNLENLFVLMSAALVFLMHVGFAVFECGHVQAKNRQTIVFKNIINLLATAFAWWSLGYMVFGPYGLDSSTDDSWFMGTERAWGDTPAFLGSVPKTGELLLTWFYGFLMAATAATIVSGAVAERVCVSGFVFFVICFTGFIWPVVAYWVWNPHGWLCNGASGDANPNDPGMMVTQGIETLTGVLDWSGSSVVFMTGGCAALVAAVVVGPRVGRFDEEGFVNKPTMDSSSLPFFGFGTLLLWVGWFGFNVGSPWAGHGLTSAGGAVTGLVVVNTVLAPIAAGLVYYLLSLVPGMVPDVTGVYNCIVAGLVAVSCSCDCIQPYAAFVLGITVAPVFIGSSWLLKKLRVDDVCEGISMFYFCGMWGMLFLGLFCDPDLESRSAHKHGWWYGDDGTLFGWQIAAVLSITLWVAVMSLVVLVPLQYLGLLRVSEEQEEAGLDCMYMKYPSVEADVLGQIFDEDCCGATKVIDTTVTGAVDAMGNPIGTTLGAMQTAEDTTRACC